MKRAPYCNKYDVLNLVILHAFCKAMRSMAEEEGTPVDWRRKMRTAATYAERIKNDRLACLCSGEEVLATARRAEHTTIKVLTSDALKMIPKKKNAEESCITDKTITLETDDYLDLVQLGHFSCMACSQGNKVEGCRWRKLFHKLGVPVIRDTPCAGECEYRGDNVNDGMEPVNEFITVERL